MQERGLAVVILGAEHGAKKVVPLQQLQHPVNRETALLRMLRVARDLSPARILVVLKDREDETREALKGEQYEILLQREQCELGDTLLWVEDALQGFTGDLLVLSSSVCLLRPETLQVLIEMHVAEENAGTILTTRLDDPTGYDRIVRDEKGRVNAVREEADLRPEEERITEISSGVVAFQCRALFEAIRQIEPDDKRPLRSLADAVGMMRCGGGGIGTVALSDPWKILTGNVPDLLLGANGVHAMRQHDEGAGPVGCRRCHGAFEISAETGLLVTGEHACLGVESPEFNNGQLVVFPRRHITSLLSLSGDEILDVSRLVILGEETLRKIYRFDALNIGFTSGDGEHLAIQVIPRWVGDLNFLPLVSGLKIAPESPARAWARFREVMS
ncbi:MAG: hypothetical protein KAY24_14450 [Candidatus Eisenbacteria sp.]|nr:hypothetical protein [Candidatus Eisenbacteria bacterium]